MVVSRRVASYHSPSIPLLSPLLLASHTLTPSRLTAVDPIDRSHFITRPEGRTPPLLTFLFSLDPLFFPCQWYARYCQGQQRVTPPTSLLPSFSGNCYCRARHIRATGGSRRQPPTASNVGSCGGRGGGRTIGSAASFLPAWDEWPWLHTFE